MHGMCRTLHFCLYIRLGSLPFLHKVSLRMEKSKSFNGYPASYSEIRLGFEDRSRSYSFNGPSNAPARLESSGNPELKRRRRVASYNMYTMEGKLKSSLRNSFKWIKSKFSHDFYDM